MDKQTVIGLALMVAVIIGFSIFNQPSQEQLEAQKHYQDSVLAVQKQKQLETEKNKQLLDSTKADSAKAKAMYGDFGASMNGSDENVVLENEVIRLELSSKGGAPAKVTLKDYKTYDKKALELFRGNDNHFNLELPTATGNAVNTADLYFKTVAKTDSSVTLAVNAGVGQLAYTYTLHKGSYLVNFDVTTTNLKGMLSSKKSTRLVWESKVPRQERSATFENRYAELTYKEFGSTSVDNLSSMGTDDEIVEEPIHWIAFKDQYFSSVLIADGGKPMTGVKLYSESQAKEKDSKYVQHYTADVQLDFDATANQTSKFRYFFGPNEYTLLHGYDDNNEGDEVLKLNKLVSLGWFIFRWVNQYLIIRLFNFLGLFISNYGLLIFLVTLIIKLVLFPLTYKSYLSTAKMRVLKPEIERLTAEIPEENTMERSQVSMQVYQKAGVSPMGGCLPMLLSMPFLIAMFWFFPSAIELRGQSFLWADDLSAYDSVLDFGFNIPFYGDHISLFCLLMTIVNIVYTKFNMQMTDTGAQQQMPMMKYMMYLMPIMFLFWFNDYASGLTYYYLVSLLITIVQTIAIRYSVNDEDVLRKIHEKAEKNKNSNKKGWMQRLAEMQEEQQKMMKQQQQKRK